MTCRGRPSAGAPQSGRALSKERGAPAEGRPYRSSPTRRQKSQRSLRTEVLAIYATVLSVFEIAKAQGIATYKAADRLAERRLREGVDQ